MSASKPTIETQRVRLSTKLKYIIMPISQSAFAASLKEIGFTTPQRVVRSPIGSGVAFEPAVVYGEKGENKVDMDSSRGIIGIDGTNPADVVSDFRRLEDMLKQSFGLDIEKRTWFLEAIAEFTVTTHRNTLDVLRTSLPDAKLLEKLGNAMGEQVGPFGIRLCSPNSEPLDENWFDFRIEPVVTSLKSYFLSFVYRNEVRSKVYNFLGGLESRALKLIATAEQGSSSIPK